MSKNINVKHSSSATGAIVKAVVCTRNHKLDSLNLFVQDAQSPFKIVLYLSPCLEIFQQCLHPLECSSSLFEKTIYVNSLAVAVSAIEEWIQTVIQKDSAVGWHELNELLGLPQ